MNQRSSHSYGLWPLFLMLALSLAVLGCKNEQAEVKGNTEANAQSTEEAEGAEGEDSPVKQPEAASEDEEPAQPAATDDDSATDDASPPTSTAPGDTMRVEMLDPGAEPRKELRYQFSAGNKQEVDIVMDMSASVEMAGKKMPQNALPTTRSRLTLNSSEVDDDGTLRYEYELTGVQVSSEGNPDLVKVMEEQMKLLEGLKGWATVDNRGMLLDSKMTPPDSATPQLGEQLSQMEKTFQQIAVPLPEEPVGVGAKWRATTESENNGVTVRQVTDYELAELNGTSGTFKISITQDADPQQINRPDLPPGTEVKLEKLESKGTGTSAFDLTKLVPDARTDIDMTMHMTMKKGAQSAEMKMSSKLSVVLKSPDKEAP